MDNRTRIVGKRSFCLVDEKESIEVPEQIGKKLKLGLEEMDIIENIVEEGSLKWPQPNQ